MIEAYKSLNKPSPIITLIHCSHQNGDKIHCRMTCLWPLVKTVAKGKDSAKYLGAVTWNSIPSYIRQQDCLEKFRDLIKKMEI